jgi:pimeloyl-ACP methyl ester carboxylesterase
MKYTALAAFIVTLALCCSYLWVDSRLDEFKPPAGAVLHSVSATKLYALDEGSGDTIVLIHGGGGSIDDWTALRSRLRQTSRVITVERPGNGWSGPYPSEPEDYLAANAALVRELLESMGVHDSTVVGWSYGGAVALRLAADSPSLVAALVHLCGMGPGYDPYESSVGAALRLGKLLDVPIFGPIIDRSVRPGLIDLLPRSRWMEVQYGPRWAILSEETLERTLLGMLRSKLSAVRETSQVRADLARLTPRLHGVAQPTLIVSGGLDPVIPIHVGEDLESILPNAQRVVLPGARHAHHVVAPGEVSSLILDFIARER